MGTGVIATVMGAGRVADWPLATMAAFGSS